MRNGQSLDLDMGLVPLLRQEKYEIIEPSIEDIKSGNHDPYIIKYIKGDYMFYIDLYENDFTLYKTNDLYDPIIEGVSLNTYGEELYDIFLSCKREISINELFN